MNTEFNLVEALEDLQYFRGKLTRAEYRGQTPDSLIKLRAQITLLETLLREKGIVV